MSSILRQLLVVQLACLLGLVNVAHATTSDELIKAAKTGDITTALSLLGQGADANTKDKDGYTVLILAAMNGHVNVVQALLERGANVHARENKYGVNALMLASYNGYADIVEKLIAAGADVNAKDSLYGDTSLMAACEKGHTEVVRILLDHGANVIVKTTRGDTALSLATRMGHKDIVKLLLQHSTVSTPTPHSKKRLFSYRLVVVVSIASLCLIVFLVVVYSYYAKKTKHPPSNPNMAERPVSASKETAMRDKRSFLNIATFGYTILGLVTGGVFWGFYLAQWSRKHQRALSGISSRVGIPTSRRSVVLGRTMAIMGMVLLFLLGLAFFTGWDVTANNGPFEIDEEFFWFLCWVASALLALTWGSVMFEVRCAMSIVGPRQVDSWLLSGGAGRVIFFVLLNATFALGLLALVIFPPIAASALNKYVHATHDEQTESETTTPQEKKRMSEGKQRHGCLTALLLAFIIMNALGALMNLFGGAMIRQTFPDAPGWALPVLGIAGILNLVCLIALFEWKKWGFYGAVALAILGFVVNLVVGLNILQALLGLVGIAVLYGVLQIGGDKKGWTQLE